ncbi:hypothetical protein STANM309S_04915 [Streptomyces tanashiensis]
MAKTQLGARVDSEIELAEARARDRGLSLGDYIAVLVHEDTEGLRQRGLAAAERFLAEHQGVFDEAEDADGRARSARRVMELHIDVPWILRVAEIAGAGIPPPRTTECRWPQSPLTGPSCWTSPSTTAPTPRLPPSSVVRRPLPMAGALPTWP